MEDLDPKIVTSSLSGRATEGRITVRVEIFKLDQEPKWWLEVVNEAGTSTVWDDPFETDAEAYASFRGIVAKEGLETFLSQARIIPYPY